MEWRQLRLAFGSSELEFVGCCKLSSLSSEMFLGLQTSKLWLLPSDQIVVVLWFCLLSSNLRLGAPKHLNMTPCGWQTRLPRLCTRWRCSLPFGFWCVFIIPVVIYLTTTIWTPEQRYLRHRACIWAHCHFLILCPLLISFGLEGRITRRIQLRILVKWVSWWQATFGTRKLAYFDLRFGCTKHRMSLAGGLGLCQGQGMILRRCFQSICMMQLLQPSDTQIIKLLVYLSLLSIF